MTLAVWFVAVGLCDLLRAAQDATSARRRVLVVATGLTTLAWGGVFLDLDTATWLSAGPVWALGLVGWVLCSSKAVQPGRPGRQSRGQARGRAAAFGVFGLTVLALALLPGPRAQPAEQVSADARASLATLVGADALTILTAALVLQLATANLLVRMLLDAVGTPASAGEKQLKGGRVLGPMERLLIVGLSLAGQAGAAAVVVAAKGLLRWPEVRRLHDSADRPGGPATDVSEYFLIGSLGSWLVALGGWLLAAGLLPG